MASHCPGLRFANSAKAGLKPLGVRVRVNVELGAAEEKVVRASRERAMEPGSRVYMSFGEGLMVLAVP